MFALSAHESAAVAPNIGMELSAVAPINLLNCRLFTLI
jgi:hypothetical protein